MIRMTERCCLLLQVDVRDEVLEVASVVATNDGLACFIMYSLLGNEDSDVVLFAATNSNT